MKFFSRTLDAILTVCLFARREKAADPTVRRISSRVNGPLFEAVADQAQCHDKRAIELFRQGGQVVDILERCLRFLTRACVCVCVCVGLHCFW